MSHEIRTPMNAVIGMTGLLLRHRPGRAAARAGGDGARQRRVAAGDHQRRAGLLQDRGRASWPWTSGRSRCGACVQQAINLVALTADAKGLHLSSHLDRRLPGDGRGRREPDPADPGQPARQRGQVHRPRRHHGDRHGGAGSGRRRRPGRIAVRIAVRDTGIGIPPDRLDRLFLPFSQVDASVARSYGGSGLGLVISRRLAEAMDGGITVDSAPGRVRRSRSTVRADGRPTRAAAAPALPSPAAPAGRSLHVLVAEDNPVNQRVAAVAAGTAGPSGGTGRRRRRGGRGDPAPRGSTWF